MFIRIAKKDSTITYECYKVNYVPNNINEDPSLTKGTLFIKTLQEKEIEVLVDFNEDSVYYMNNEGKTIEVLNQV